MMDADQLTELRTQLFSPVETLGFERKAWIDPTQPAGIAKIAKGLMALHNNDGGRFVVGISDDGVADPNRPSDVKTVFSADALQAIVNQHSSEKFEISVDYLEHEGATYPLVSVKPGVRTPAVCVRGVSGDDKGKLIRVNAVYVRSNAISNKVSSTEPRVEDWDPLIRRCLDNREADIGAFLRRHLAADQMKAMREFFSLAGSPRPNPELVSLDHSFERFLKACDSKAFDPKQLGYVRSVREIGTREFVALVPSDFEFKALNRDLLNQLDVKRTRVTGWPPWIGLSDGHLEYSDNGPQSFVVVGFGPPKLDFWRIDPSGFLYQLQVLEDDVHYQQRRPDPNSSLDWVLQITRTAELLLSSLEFVRLLTGKSDGFSVICAMRWRNLSGRQLFSWVAPNRGQPRASKAIDNEIRTTVEIPVETAPASLGTYVAILVEPLFLAFGGAEIDRSVIEELTRETISRRM